MIPDWLITLGTAAIVVLTLWSVWACGVGRGHQIGWDDAHRLHLDEHGRSDQDHDAA